MSEKEQLFKKMNDILVIGEGQKDLLVKSSVQANVAVTVLKLTIDYIETLEKRISDLENLHQTYGTNN